MPGGGYSVQVLQYASDAPARVPMFPRTPSSSRAQRGPASRPGDERFAEEVFPAAERCGVAASLRMLHFTPVLVKCIQHCTVPIACMLSGTDRTRSCLATRARGRTRWWPRRASRWRRSCACATRPTRCRRPFVEGPHTTYWSFLCARAPKCGVRRTAWRPASASCVLSELWCTWVSTLVQCPSLAACGSLLLLPQIRPVPCWAAAPGVFNVMLNVGLRFFSPPAREVPSLGMSLARGLLGEMGLSASPMVGPGW